MDEVPQLPHSFWIIGYSKAPCREMEEILHQITQELMEEIRFRTLVISEAHRVADVIRALDQEKGLCGALLILERDALDREEFTEAARWCEQHIVQPEFRLFFHAYDMDYRTVREQVHRTSNDVLRSLYDAVQETTAGAIEQLLDELQSYFAGISDISAEIAWAKRRDATIRAVGIIAGGIQLVVLGVFIILIIIETWNQLTARNDVSVSKSWFSVLLGLSFAGFSVPGALLLDRTHDLSIDPQAKQVRRTVLMCASGAVLLLMIGILFGLGMPWFAGGVVAGAIVDHLRRTSSREFLRAQHVQAPSQVAERSPESEHSLTPSSLIPFVLPVLPISPHRVFISYARSSDWGRRIAGQLHEALQKKGCSSFLDRVGIPHGVSWSKMLDFQLGRATDVIILADSVSGKRSWVNAELSSALRSYQRTGLPKIIVLIEPELSDAEFQDSLPAFLLVQQSGWKHSALDAPTLLRVREKTIDSLLNQFAFAPVFHGSPSLLSDDCARWAKLLLWFMCQPVILASMASLVLGNLVLYAAIIGYVIGGRSLGWLSVLGKFPILPLFCFLSLGCTLRLLVAVKFQLKDPRDRESLPTHCKAALGFAILLLAWSGSMSALELIWGLNALGIGWLYVAGFIQRESHRDPDFLRKSVS